MTLGCKELEMASIRYLWVHLSTLKACLMATFQDLYSLLRICREDVPEIGAVEAGVKDVHNLYKHLGINIVKLLEK